MSVSSRNSRRPGRPDAKRRAGFLAVATALLLALATALSACGGGDSEGGDSKSLTLGMTNDLFPALKKPIEQWGTQHGIDVTIREMPSDTGAYFDQMRTMLQATSGEVDLFAGDISWPAQFGSNGWIADLSKDF